MDTDDRPRTRVHLHELLLLAILAGLGMGLIAPSYFKGLTSEANTRLDAMGRAWPYALMALEVGVAGTLAIFSIGRLAMGFLPRAAIITGFAVLGITVQSFVWGSQATPKPNTEGGAYVACKNFCEAQEQFATTYQNRGDRHYAVTLQELNEFYEGRVATYAGLADAEYWPERSADALIPYNGYIFKVLKSQSAHAQSGKRVYETTAANGKPEQTEGFALVACPFGYNQTGRNTYIVNQDGRVYRRDLGPDTPAKFREMKVFDPDNEWSPAE